MKRTAVLRDILQFVTSLLSLGSIWWRRNFLLRRASIYEQIRHWVFHEHTGGRAPLRWSSRSFACWLDKTLSL